MGEVWLGKHVAQDVDVVIKVITRRNTRSEKFIAGFRNEVSAVARLDHPGVVAIFDYGEVTTEAAAVSDRRLVEGSPYFVMEFASGGTLHGVPKPMPFGKLKTLLLFLLDALAHCHARGVIHRDLKPANILLSSSSDLRPGPKLTDFGIAFAEGNTDSLFAKGSIGSPPYMAPEQWFARWRDYGPWTDLYAVGCLAYELATGGLPYPGNDRLIIADGHLTGDLPKIEDMPSLPSGLDGWITRLLQKDPEDRFQRAADAAAVLNELEGEETEIDSLVIEDDPVSTCLDTVEIATVALKKEPLASKPGLGPVVGRTTSDGQTDGITEHTRDPHGVDRCCSIPLAHIPKDWRSSRLSTPSIRLLGVGLGLFGVRTIPVVDRTEEMDVLWEELQIVHKTKRPRFVVLSGPAGCGKSRLVEWFGQRAHELGAATVWQTVHSPFPGLWSGLSPMLARVLGCTGLSRDEVLSRVVRFYRIHGVDRPYEWGALTELISPQSVRNILDERGCEPSDTVSRPTLEDGSPERDGTKDFSFRRRRQRTNAELLSPKAIRDTVERDRVSVTLDIELAAEELAETRVQLTESRQRYALVQRLVALQAKNRPLVLWLDDVQWGLETLELAQFLCREPCDDPLPVLIVATTQDESLLQEPQVAELLATCLNEPTAQKIALNPLTPADHRELVQRLLFLDEALSSQVEELSGGIPLFAIQLVGEWVRRGLLEVSSEGFVLKEGERVELPEDIHLMWMGNVERLLDEITEGQADAPVETTNADRVTALSILELAAVLGCQVEVAEWRAAVEWSGWSWPNGLVGLVERHRLMPPHQSGGVQLHNLLREALNRSAKENGRWRELNIICATMLASRYPERPRGIWERLGNHQFEGGLCDEAASSFLKAARRQWRRGEMQRCLDLIAKRDRALDGLDLPADDIRRVPGWLRRAAALTKHQKLEEAQKWADQSIAVATSHDAEGLLADGLLRSALVDVWRAQYEKAESKLMRAQELYQNNKDLRKQARCAIAIASAVNPRGLLDQAREHLQSAVALAKEAKDWEFWAIALRKLANLDVDQNKPDSAEELCQRALDHHTNAGERQNVAACLNSLGNIHLTRGDLESAQECYRDALDTLRAIGNSIDAMTTQLNLALVMLETEQFSEARNELTSIIEACEKRGIRSLEAFARSLLLPALAAQHDWTAWDDELPKAKKLLNDTGVVDADTLDCIRTAGEHCVAAGKQERGRQAFKMALTLAHALNDDKAIEALSAMIEGFRE